MTEKRPIKSLHFRSLNECMVDAGSMVDSDSSKASLAARTYHDNVLPYLGRGVGVCVNVMEVDWFEIVCMYCIFDH